MNKFSIALITLICIHVPLFSQVDNVGAGYAIKFDGIDDYIDLGNIYDDVSLPVTVSAWVYVEDQAEIITLPIFDSQDNSSLYNGFTLITSTIPHVGFYYGDGMGGNNPAYRRARAGYFEKMGRWVYLTGTANSATDIRTYLNGYNISNEYQGSSTSPMNSNSPSEVAKIGFLYGNGNTFHFKGIMDELRIWNRMLSEQEIRETMCRRLQGDEPGLIGYWNFDETSGDILIDQSPNQFNGVLKGNPTRVFSGAPIGDESVFVYANNWEGQTLAMDDISVQNVVGNPYGAHIYRVNSNPTQVGGLDPDAIKLPYHGVFLAGDGDMAAFDLSLADETCRPYNRNNNSVSSWTLLENNSAIQQRTEIIWSGGDGQLDVTLGQDMIICDNDVHHLEAHSDPNGKTFRWNTGETTPAITVASSGTFSVKVTSGCDVSYDTLEVTFLKSPQPFSLGEDEILCDFSPRLLSVMLPEANLTYTWQDGSHDVSFNALDFGTYWLKVENACGVFADSVTFSRHAIAEVEYYNFMSPGNHDPFNQYFTIDQGLLGARLSVFNRWGKPVYESLSYQNDWDGGTLPSGVYFYTLQTPCESMQKGTVTIVR